MCGRFTLIHSTEEIKEAFSIEEVLFSPHVSYNIAPGQIIGAIVNGGSRKLIGLRWGLVPGWKRDSSRERGIINARAETVAVKPVFRGAFKRFRCLIPASGFYEWMKSGRKSVPHYIYMRDRRPFLMAGIYERWTLAGGEEFCGCAIITVEANALIKKVHHRMPAIIPPDKAELWLLRGSSEVSLLELLRPFPPEEMECHPVSAAVNSPRVNTPACIEKV